MTCRRGQSPVDIGIKLIRFSSRNRTIIFLKNTTQKAKFRGAIIIINMDHLTVKRGILPLLSTKAMGVKGILLQSKMFSIPTHIIQLRNNKKAEGPKGKH
jgi:hypothetical protein